jgi:hypothetical protein
MLIVSNFQRLTLQKDASSKSAASKNPAKALREQIAKRAALEFRDGMFGKLFQLLILTV